MNAPRLAGFPVNICCASLRGELGPEYATYDFDPRTFAENSDDRRMRYYPRDPSPFWVEVVISKGDGHIETRKYRGEELVCEPTGPDFPKAMIHTTILGLLDDEPADERN